MTDTLNSPTRGRFITFEGGEGAGKSTQIDMLASKLTSEGIEVVVTREPGGSRGAEIIRHMWLSGIGKLLGGDAEALLFAAARRDHVEQVIEPGLAAGKWVLCDRFTDSTRAYQGRMGGVDRRILDALQRATIGGLKPDLTLILDIPADIGLRRAAARRGKGEADRFEAESGRYHKKLRRAFREIATREPRRCVLIDATDDINGVAAAVWSVVLERLGTIVTPAEQISA